MTTRNLNPYLLFSLVAVFCFPNIIPITIIAYAQTVVNVVYSIFYQQDPLTFKFVKYQMIINAIFGLLSLLYILIWSPDLAK